MIPFRMLAIAVLLATSQVHAAKVSELAKPPMVVNAAQNNSASVQFKPQMKIQLQPSKKLSGVDTYRSDEEFFVTVSSGVKENIPAVPCAYSVGIKDDNNTYLTSLSGKYQKTQFDKIMTFTFRDNVGNSFKSGHYYVVATPTDRDSDVCPKQLVSKKIKLVRQAGDLRMLIISTYPTPGDLGNVSVRVDIGGPKCSYKVTRIINDGPPSIVTKEYLGSSKPLGERILLAENDKYPVGTKLTYVVSPTSSNEADRVEGGSCVLNPAAPKGPNANITKTVIVKAQTVEIVN